MVKNLCLAMREIPVSSPGVEDPTGLRVTEATHHSCQAWHSGALSHNYWEPTCLESVFHNKEYTAHHNQRTAPHSPQLEKAMCNNEDPEGPGNK